jgi:ribosome-interacting GTPase 1
MSYITHREYKINSADVFARCDATVDQLIDVIEGNRHYIPAIYVLNKIDQLTIEVRRRLAQCIFCSHLHPITFLITCNTHTLTHSSKTPQELDIIDQMPHHVPISAHHGWNLEELLEHVWDYTKMLRYSFS